MEILKKIWSNFEIELRLFKFSLENLRPLILLSENLRPLKSTPGGYSPLIMSTPLTKWRFSLFKAVWNPFSYRLSFSLSFTQKDDNKTLSSWTFLAKLLTCNYPIRSSLFLRQRENHSYDDSVFIAASSELSAVEGSNFLKYESRGVNYSKEIFALAPTFQFFSRLSHFFLKFSPIFRFFAALFDLIFQNFFDSCTNFSSDLPLDEVSCWYRNAEWIVANVWLYMSKNRNSRVLSESPSSKTFDD